MRAAVAEPPVTVIFRVWRDSGDVIALFPREPFDQAGRYCTSYMHVGQHGAASYHGVIQRTRPARPEEYQPLQRELESAPYHYWLIVCRRYLPRRQTHGEA